MDNRSCRCDLCTTHALAGTLVIPEHAPAPAPTTATLGSILALSTSHSATCLAKILATRTFEPSRLVELLACTWLVRSPKESLLVVHAASPDARASPSQGVGDALWQPRPPLATATVSWPASPERPCRSEMASTAGPHLRRSTSSSSLSVICPENQRVSESCSTHLTSICPHGLQERCSLTPRRCPNRRRACCGSWLLWKPKVTNQELQPCVPQRHTPALFHGEPSRQMRKIGRAHV